MTKPSWQDFGTHDESIAPELWDGVVGAWAPCLGPTGSRLHDMSRSSNWGTLTNMNNATDWVLSGGQYALDFDGSNDFVDLGNSASLSNASGTLCFLMPRKATNKVASIIARNGNLDVWPKFGVGFEGNRMFLSSNTDVSNNAGSTIVPYSAVNDGDHFAIAWSGLVARCYQNSQLVATITRLSGFDNVPTAKTVIGRSGEFNNYYYDGQIDDVLLYSRALTQHEVQQLYQLGRGGMYQRRRRRAIYLPQAGFQAAWALRRSQIIGGGLR